MPSTNTTLRRQLDEARREADYWKQQYRRALVRIDEPTPVHTHSQHFNPDKGYCVECSILDPLLFRPERRTSPEKVEPTPVHTGTRNFALRLPEPVYNRVKNLGFFAGRSMNEIITSAVQHYLDQVGDWQQLEHMTEQFRAAYRPLLDQLRDIFLLEHDC